MPTQVQIRGAIQATQEARTLVSRELDVNTTDTRLSVHDGSTAGGIAHANFLDVVNQTFSYANATGTNALTMSLEKDAGSYIAGQKVAFKAASNNTGSATLNVNSNGAVTLKKISGASIVDLEADDIIADAIYEVTYDGTNFILGAGGAGGGGLQSIQTFTSSATWTKPSGIKKVLVEVQGRGGSGGSTDFFGNVGGGGGGGGGYSRKFIDVSAISNESVTIGATCSFGSHCSATSGGNGSTYDSNLSPYRLGGGGGGGVGGDINIRGSDGSNDGHGGSSVLGGGGRSGGGNNDNGLSGNLYGGGGGGASSSNSTKTGGAGAQGIVIVWEFA